MIKQGYAFSYRQYPTKMLDKFNNLEKYARENNLGLWGSCPSSAKPTITQKVYKTNNTIVPTKQIQQIVIPTTSTPLNSTNNQPAQSAPAYSGGGDKDCKDFATHAEAQSYFISKGGSPTNNVDRLDADHDGIACESLP